jgi:hypothetical protein
VKALDATMAVLPDYLSQSFWVMRNAIQCTLIRNLSIYSSTDLVTAICRADTCPVGIKHEIALKLFQSYRLFLPRYSFLPRLLVRSETIMRPKVGCPPLGGDHSGVLDSSEICVWESDNFTPVGEQV